jgi:hypothetical protein
LPFIHTHMSELRRSDLFLSSRGSSKLAPTDL